ncbi:MULTISPECIES: lasso peptide biosynthesis protein [Vibrio]|uniref:lasso peptide biosynthesis protein n=1 Tax=Vibrio TaxID=662 RepID=UPI0004226BCB|nr:MULTISPECIES: lasso peptide biosynthesis protein [Vibrio]EHK4785653.1 lasso peptide biosynthesis protein [Vibrio parahaemolyticus]EIJ0975359.1 lasso peptide biosynthesis protein [Vibrio parahaemolyticus]EJO4006030.1 lasso peptide biosynthesis protein [Vibrio parahaemolyticus]MBM4905397.1 lasso peptide biosynthesis protein [Vibrio parahaemolyticus]MBM4990908.1 lasso peptide biosynthesis protein [Vibrio parahaemolyticus]
MESWLAIINRNIQNKNDEIISQLYSELLQFIVETEYKGGCHDTSAVLHVVLNELGIKNSLCIGEVKTGEKYFDHSWIEIDGKIYDAAICMPLDGGLWHPPVFASIDLDSETKTELGYGIPSPVGLDEPARSIAQINLGNYALQDPMPNRLWYMAEQFASELGYELDAEELAQKYASKLRVLRGDSL